MGSDTCLPPVAEAGGQLVDQDTEAPPPPCFITSLVGGNGAAEGVGAGAAAEAGAGVMFGAAAGRGAGAGAPGAGGVVTPLLAELGSAEAGR